VDQVFGGDPLILGVPSHHFGVTEGDVVDVEEHLVGALSVPCLPAGIPRVGEDDPHSALGPGESVAVSVTGSVVCGWARDGVGGERLGDGE
jgi:hypothetical protein